MTVTPTHASRKPTVRDLLVVWVVGLVMAAGLGAVATLIRPEQFWLVLGIFTACALAPCLSLAWLLVGHGRHVDVDPRADENVESRWIEKAGSRALFDVMAAAGVTAGAVGLFGLDLSADLAL